MSRLPAPGTPASRVLMAGLPVDLAPWLGERLGGAPFIAARSGRNALEELNGNAISLLILDHGVADPPAMEVLREARARESLDPLEVIYCLDETADRRLPRKLVRELGVRQVLFHPIDPHELARQAASILGVDSKPAVSDFEGDLTVDKEQDLIAKLAAVWGSAESRVRERLGIVERAGSALLEGKLSPELRLEAEREAHRLAGSLGIFGFERASRFAREIEHLLQGGTRLSESRALRFSELAVALRLELERNSGGQSREHQSPPQLLIVDGDRTFAERLAEQATGRGIEAQIVPDVVGARELIRSFLPKLVLLDLCASPSADESLNLLTELTDCNPAVIAVVLASQERFMDRIEVARRGGSGFFPKSLSAAEILDSATGLLERREASKASILAVDDDPQVLEGLTALLEPQGLRVTALDDPLRFWEVLEGSSPDLVVLDIDMPHLSGVELCRVLRNDLRWSSLPVIFLTSYKDARTVHRVFAAGADDFVSKPIVGPELKTRILNRLERTRLLKSMAETDSLTGVANRRKSARMLEDFLGLAARHHQALCFAMLRLDGLQELNARYGRAAGDEILRRLGALLQRTFRSQDIVARWAGDEFAVGMYGLCRRDGVQRIAEILEIFREETFRDPTGTEFRATFSAGVADYPADASNLEELSRMADEARRHAERAGGDRVVPAGWDPEQRNRLKEVDVALAIADEAQATLLLHALQTRGYRARELRDGKVAAELMTGSVPGLQARVVLLDADLPSVDGLCLLRRFAAEGILDRTRVIMLTSPAIGDEVAAAVELGAFDHVAKPFSLPVLVNRIRRALES